MLPARTSPWRGILFTALLFAIEFLLHILFAAKAWDLAFLLVAIDLFFFSLFFAPIALILGGPSDHQVGQRVITIGTTIAVPLTMGYFWALNGMQWSDWLIGSAALPMASQVLWFRWERGLSGFLYSPFSDEEE